METKLELNILLAEKVMKSEYQDYSADIAIAWQIVEKLGTQLFELHYFNGKWSCRFGLHIRYYVQAFTAPHAICLAAWQAVNWNEDNKGSQ
jgi:hypothetical protein